MPPSRCGLVHSTAVDVGGRCDVAAGRAALAPGDRAPASPLWSPRGSALTDLVGSFGPVFVVSAAVFGPLSGWLAGRRDRNPVVWLVFGTLLGPLALVLLWLAPPGRCSMCDTPVRGWASICLACGGPLTGAAGAGRYQSMDREAIESFGPAFETTAQRVQAEPYPASSRTAPGLTMLPPQAVAGGTQDDIPTPPIRLPIERSRGPRVRRPGIAERAAVTSPRSPLEQDQMAAAEILATAVYFGGTAGLAVGGRYVITRQGTMFRLLGPVDLDPTRVALERPLARLAAAAVGERLVITEGDGSRVSLAIGLGALAGMTGPELEVALSAPEEPRADRRPASG
jgi:hypothetical protein